jgi:hypothetical protein
MLPGTTTSSKRALTAAVLLAIALSGCEPTSTQPASDPAERAFTATSCDENNTAFDVEPDTAEARAAATDWCVRMAAAIDNAPWPSGLTPAPLPIGEG